MTEPDNTQAENISAEVREELPVQEPAQEPAQEPENTHAEGTTQTDATPKVFPKLSERELKEKINLLRQKLEQNERELKNTFREISLHNDGGQELKAKRDDLNARVKEMSLKASELRKKRDETNARIAELKSMREQLKGKGKEFSGKIGELKKSRDELNKTARGRVETLEKAYDEELNMLLTVDIPLEHEINIFNRLTELSQRLDATKKANELHTEISVEYNRAKEIYTDVDSLHAQIQALAPESQKYHEEMMAIYNEIDEVRKAADSYHAQLSEKYKGIAPLRKRISALKGEIPKLREELGVYLEQMKEVQLARDEQKNEGKRELAKEKFQKNGRLSLDEFRILVENKDIKL